MSFIQVTKIKFNLIAKIKKKLTNKTLNSIKDINIKLMVYFYDNLLIIKSLYIIVLI
jgi:hypothetical protein